MNYTEAAAWGKTAACMYSSTMFLLNYWLALCYWSKIWWSMAWDSCLVQTHSTHIYLYVCPYMHSTMEHPGAKQLRLNKNKLPHEPFLKKPPFRQSPGWPGQLGHPGGQISKESTLAYFIRVQNWEGTRLEVLQLTCRDSPVPCPGLFSIWYQCTYGLLAHPTHSLLRHGTHSGQHPTHSIWGRLPQRPDNRHHPLTLRQTASVLR